MRKVVVAATQMSCSEDINENIKKAEGLVREASKRGAQIVLLQELFETPYFCKKEKVDFFNLATTTDENMAVLHFRKVAAELGIVIPISFYERKNNARYNSVAVIDADGSVLGTYRKTHIPQGPGYEEKFYFNPGDTGFKVWDTKYAKIGIGICWDQWFPETARCMALMGAEIILYPTAIGSEPEEEEIDSKNHWQLCMQGHAAANLVPVVASNRVGTEILDDVSITFYGSSFIAGHTGEMLQVADRTSETLIACELDLDAISLQRASWGIFRDRRPYMYKGILTSDGSIT